MSLIDRFKNIVGFNTNSDIEDMSKFHVVPKLGEKIKEERGNIYTIIAVNELEQKIRYKIITEWCCKFEDLFWNEEKKLWQHRNFRDSETIIEEEKRNGWKFL